MKMQVVQAVSVGAKYENCDGPCGLFVSEKDSSSSILKVCPNRLRTDSK